MEALERFAVVDAPCFGLHRADGHHPECPERLDAARSGLARALPPALRVPVAARFASEPELVAAHSSDYLRDLQQRISSGAGFLDADTFFTPATREAAWSGAGGAAALADELMAGYIRRGFALLRPPGHHAESARAMGFCLLNNVAVAARAAQRAGARRVAIIDWDVHHGNGTQEIFEHDPEILFVSIHQWPLYPGTGAATEVGLGRGVGATCNLALPEGSGDEVYGEAFRRVVLPLLRAHRPDVILVSAGFDAHARDPLGEMQLSERMYGAMTHALVREAEALGHGRVGFLLEGGYDLAGLEASVAETVAAAVGSSGPELPEGQIPGPARDAINATVAALDAVLPGPLGAPCP